MRFSASTRLCQFAEVEGGLVPVGEADDLSMIWIPQASRSPQTAIGMSFMSLRKAMMPSCTDPLPQTQSHLSLMPACRQTCFRTSAFSMTSTPQAWCSISHTRWMPPDGKPIQGSAVAVLAVTCPTVQRSRPRTRMSCSIVSTSTSNGFP